MRHNSGRCASQAHVAKGFQPTFRTNTCAGKDDNLLCHAILRIVQGRVLEIHACSSFIRRADQLVKLFAGCGNLRFFNRGNPE